MDQKYGEIKENKRDCYIDYAPIQKTLAEYADDIVGLCIENKVDHEVVIHHIRYYLQVRSMSKYWVRAYLKLFAECCREYLAGLSTEQYMDLEYLFKLQVGYPWRSLAESAAALL